MARQIRLSLVVAASLLSTACSAQEQRSGSVSGKRIADGPRTDDQTRGQKSHASIGPAMSQPRILISSEWGEVTAELVENDATRALVNMLPARIEMRDHLRQEKTGKLPAPLAEAPRQTAFTAGTLGLWGKDDFVIYYRDGRVPEPGIIVLGHVTSDVSTFDRPGPVTIQVQRSD